jgi:hypothetical protein
MKIDNSGNKKVPAFIPMGQEVMERYAGKVTGMAEYCMSRIPSPEGASVTDITSQLILLEKEWKKKQSN